MRLLVFVLVYNRQLENILEEVYGKREILNEVS